MCLESPHPAFLPLFLLEMLSCLVRWFLGGQSPCRECWVSVRLRTSLQWGQCWSWPLCSSSRAFGVPIPGDRTPELPLLSSVGFYKTPSPLKWVLGLFTELFCSCPVPGCWGRSCELPAPGVPPEELCLCRNLRRTGIAILRAAGCQSEPGNPEEMGVWAVSALVAGNFRLPVLPDPDPPKNTPLNLHHKKTFQNWITEPEWWVNGLNRSVVSHSRKLRVESFRI